MFSVWKQLSVCRLGWPAPLPPTPLRRRVSPETGEEQWLLYLTPVQPLMVQYEHKPCDKSNAAVLRATASLFHSQDFPKMKPKKLESSACPRFRKKVSAWESKYWNRALYDVTWWDDLSQLSSDLTVSQVFDRVWHQPAALLRLTSWDLARFCFVWL